MGYWLMAQCDTYTPAACAAKDAFEAAFPPSKQPEAIAFCKDEITSIRSAYFEFISALCQRIPQLMKEEASKVSPSVLLSIDDSDPVVCPALWEAVLYTLTTVELIPLIDTVLEEPRLQHGQLFNHLAETLSSWEAKADMEKDDKTAHNLENVLLNFWEKLSEICVKKINEPEADVKSVLGVSNLLQVLQKSNKKKNGKVRFADEIPGNNIKSEKCGSSEGENSENSELMTESFTHNSSNLLSPLRKKPLEDLVCKLAEMSFNYVSEQKSEQHLRFLSTLLDSFSSSHVFKMLLGDEKHSTIKAKSPEIAKLAQKNPAVQFLYRKLIGWLNEDQRKDAGFLVDILYSALRCCDSDVERKDVLDDLTKVDLKCNSLLQVIEKVS
ncbi:E3 ubiquitin-protein ligase listerin [Tupaia chinensis]|uniref:E3 ubiquitin-protein ligase listerin n=1 Tax=Tupaia chinensis TaxID=246437 RepID=L8Y9T3_TUPCH|nr:E3 ubiquitin-protein ligase listerin [Tupaia chinensis]